MGRRGPAPTPTAVLKLRGSTLVTKRRQMNETQGPAGTPEQPDWLDGEARKMWERLLPMLDGMGVLTRVDGNALARYCRLWSRWRNAEEFIDEKGEMYSLKDEKGAVKCFVQWPQVAIASKLAQQLTRLEQEFGMTPSARSRLQVQGSTSERHENKNRFFRTA